MNYAQNPFAATIITALLLASPTLTRANHGPGASGGGNATISGETLKQGHFELDLREDFTKFEHFSRTAATERAIQGGDFDALDHGFITTLSGAYGVTDDIQVGLSIGYFIGNDFVGADSENGDVELASTNPKGLTDLALTGKFRIFSGKPGNLAFITGVIFPTGRDNARLSNGEALSPTDQPGTGRWAIPFGLGYSRFLTPQLTMDASLVYTYRFTEDGFKVGDRFDAGIALAYRLTPSIRTFPQYSVFAELNNVFLAHDVDHGVTSENSGSDTLYITPGLRIRFDPTWALTVAPSFPVFEDLNGDQGGIEYKIAISLSYSH